MTRRRRSFLPRPRLYEILVVLHVLAAWLVVRRVARLDVGFVGTFLQTGVFFGPLGLNILAYFGVRALLVLFARSGGRARAALFARSWWRPTAFVDLLRLGILTDLVTWAYAWLKLSVPLLHAATWDAAVRRLDAALHFGVEPAVVARRLLDLPFLARLLDLEYAAFLVSTQLGVAWFFSTLSLRERARFAAGFAALWSVGVWIYAAVPVAGPCFSVPEELAATRATLPIQASAQATLAKNYATMKRLAAGEPAAEPIVSMFGVAAMPSLHVGAHAFLALWARRRCRPAFLVFAVLTPITFVGSVASGWHWAVDGYAGLLLAWLAYRLGET